MTSSASIISGWALVQRSVIQHYGLDASTLYADEGLDINKISDPDYRYPVEPFNRIWQRVSHETGDNNVGLTAAKFVLPTTFQALGLSMWASCTAKDALERFVKYSKILHDGGSAIIQEDDHNCSIVINRHLNSDGLSLVTHEGIDCLLGSLVNLFRHLDNADFSPIEIHLKRPPSNENLYRQFYRCPIVFEADRDRLVFDSNALIRPLPSGNSELAGLNDKAAINYLTRFEKNDLLFKLKNTLIKRISRGCGSINQSSIASEMAMSVRSLQRALKEKDTNFTEVVDALRKELAREYLQQKKYNLGEVAYLLGFSKPNNFSRAFKQWYGQSPSEFLQASQPQ